MARRQLTEKEKLYAKVILDLANAKDTNQAGLQYIENIQQAFGLPDEFKHGLRETFPVQPDAKEFVNNIMRHIENIKMEIIEKGGFDVRQTGFTSFTYKEYTLIFGERRAFDVLISSNGSPIVSKMDCAEIEHLGVYSISKAMYHLLAKICNKEPLLRDVFLSDLILAYNESYEIDIDDNYRILENPIMPKDIVSLFSSEERESSIRDNLFEYLYSRPVSFCLVSLLRTDDFRNRVRRCDVCSNFFIAYDGRKRCSENCKKNHERNYMRYYMKEYPR